MTEVTNPEEIWNKYSDHNQNKPWLVISVIGDSNSFVPTTWEKTLFQTSLIETAKGAKECWILYKGDKGKLSESIRQAVENFNIRHKAGKTNLEMWRNSEMPNIKLISMNTAIEACNKKDCNFEISEDKYMEIWVELLKRIGKQRVKIMKLQQNLTIRIPVVVMVAEGDIKTIRHVEQTLKKGLPIVVVKGSGKAADVISGYLCDGEDVLTERAPLLFGTYTQHDEYSKLEKQMKSIKDHRHLISIFNVNDTTQRPLSDITSEAIIRAWARGEPGSVNKKEQRQELTTSMRSNNAFDLYAMPNLENIAKFEQDSTLLYQDADLNIDSHKLPIVVKPIVPGRFPPGDTKPIANEVVGPGSISGTITDRHFKNWLNPSSFPLYFFIAYQLVQLNFRDDPDKYKKNFQDLLEKAIEADKIDYVTVLLHEHDVLFNKDDLPELYEQTVRCRHCGQSVDCQHLYSIIKTKKISKKLFSKADDCMEAGRSLCRNFLHYPKEETSHKDEISISHDLLIWSLFAHRPQLATLFWKTSEHQLLTALLVTGVLKRMSATAKDIADQSVYEDLMEHSRIFEKRAFELQSFMYKEYPTEAMELMTTEFTVWDININPLQCAYDNDMYDFIAHPCAQRCLNKIWYNELGTNFNAAVKKGLSQLRCCKYPEGSSLCRFLAAPFTKFVVNYIMFMLAIFAYSAFLLTNLTNITAVEDIGGFEIFVYIWLIADMIEEYLVPKFQKSRTFKRADRWYRFRRYINDFWNVLDTMSYIITFTAIAFRFYSEIQWARRIYSFSLFMMFMRFLHFILIYRKVGVYVILIKEMMRDLARFFVILFVFMMAVGVIYHVNMYPNHNNMWSRHGVKYWRIWKMMNLPYWQIYGELLMDSIMGTDNSSCTTQKEVYENDPDIERCVEYDWILLVIAALYMLLSNLLLVNLVIALFSARFEKVRSNSEKIWRYTRYSYIMDYRLRLPAVLNWILRPIMIIIYVAEKLKCCKNKVVVDEEEKKQQDNYMKQMKTLQTMCAARCT